MVHEQKYNDPVSSDAYEAILIQHFLILEHQSNQNILLHQENGIFEVGKNRILIRVVVECHHCVAGQFQEQ